MADSQPLQPLQSEPPNGSQGQTTAPASSTQPETTDSAIKPDPDLDASIEQDVDMNEEQNAQGAGAPALAPEVEPLAAAPPPPTKKETSLREFLGKMDEYAPIVCPPALRRFPSCIAVGGILVPRLGAIHRRWMTSSL